MDINVVILDENNVILERFNIYQDGSDAEGAALIKDFAKAAFSITDNNEEPQ